MSLLTTDNYLGRGGGRVVFKIDNNTILKIPTCLNGLMQNQDEWEIWNTTKHKDKYATIYKNENDCIYMEFLEPIVDIIDDIAEKFEPYRTHEGLQLGVDKSGNYKIYDYSNVRDYCRHINGFQMYTVEQVLEYWQYINENNLKVRDLLLIDYLKGVRYCQ